MKRVTHEDLVKIIKSYTEKHRALIILGRTGIGKSQSVKEAAIARAASMKMPFVEWNATSLEEKFKVADAKDSYYVYVDLRLTQMDPTDLKGLPDLNADTVIWKPNLYVKALMNNPGTLFIDEFNLAPASLQATCYQVLLDREIGEVPLHKEVVIFAAGNLAEDRAATFEIPKPIRTRAGIYELTVPDFDAMMKYAERGTMDPRVMTFLHKFQNRIFFESDKFDDVITPRGWEFVSELIKNVDDLSHIRLISAGVLGEAVSLEFSKFLHVKDKIPSPADIISKKAELPKDIDLLYASISSIVAYFSKTAPKARIPLIKKILSLDSKFKARDNGVEFYILMLRLIKSVQNDIFKKVIGTPELARFAKNYTKYLVADEES